MALLSRLPVCRSAGAPQRPRCRARRLPLRPRASAEAEPEPERFVWKGGGDSRGAAWEAAALAGRGGYATDASGGLQWFYLDAGPATAPPLVLLHGMPAYSYLWRDVVPGLTAAGRRVIALDLPGYGNSAKPAPDAGFDYSLQAYAASLEAVLFGALKLPRGGTLDVAGQGVLGGALAALLAARAPADVRRVALLNAPLGAAQAGDMPPGLRFLLNPFTGAIVAQNPLSLMGTPLIGAGVFDISPDDTAAYIAPALADSGAGWASIAAAKGVKRTGAAAAAEGVRALEARGEDVLVIWGTEDKWYGAAPPDVLPRARRLLLTGAGHFAAEDWAEKVTQALLQL